MEVILMKSKEDVNILFKQGNTDDRILKSMAEDIDHKYNSEELSKAMNRAGLVQKEVQVRGKNGQIHTRKQWVKASEDQPSTKQPKAQEDTKETSSKPKQEEKKEHWTKVGTSQEAKSQIAQMLASGKSREDCMSDFKAQGVTWKEHENQAINWMRAAMAMNKHLTSGAGASQANDSSKSKEKTTENKKKFTDKQSSMKDKSSSQQKKFENGYIDKDGDLVADDKSDLEGLVSEITDTDMFDQKDLALEELEKNPEYKGAFIESMGIDKASQNKDGSISVTAYVEGYVEDDRDGSSENFDTYVTFDIPVKSEEKTAENKNNSKKPVTIDDIIKKINSRGDGVAPLKGRDSISTDPKGKYIYCDKNHDEDNPLSITEEQAVEIYSAYKNKEDYKKIAEKIASKNNSKSVIGTDYTQLTTEKESGTIEGEAHNMMVGWLQSENGDKKKPTKAQIKQAANSLKDAAIKRVISSYNQDELVHQLAMAKHFTKLAGGNMDHMTLERTYQDVVSGSSYTQEQKCDALAKLCGKDYDSTGDYVRKYASNSMANASIVPMSKGYFEVTFSYDDGASRKERFDSVKSAKEASDKFIEKEEKYTAEKKSK